MSSDKITEEGWHEVEVANMLDRADRTGRDYTLAILSDEDGRVAFHTLYLDGGDRRAHVGKLSLLEMALACGVEELDGTDQLRGLRCAVRMERNGRWLNAVEWRPPDPEIMAAEPDLGDIDEKDYVAF